MTNLVNEFPIKGIMGYYYALNSGEEEIVATAIREHYQPRLVVINYLKFNLGHWWA